jgi:hypothetical protein
MTIFGKILLVFLLMLYITPSILGGVVLGSWWIFIGLLFISYFWLGFLFWVMGKADGYLTQHWMNNWFVFSLTWLIRPLL